MPLAGKGMLITSMDIEPADEREFNAWYDREHLAERVAIDGFLEARRWVADRASPKYFCTYSTATFETLTSPAYRQALATQTERSKANIARFRNMGRVIGRVAVSRGYGRGAALGVVRLRPAPEGAEALRRAVRELLDPGTLEGIVSMHFVEGDAELSKSLTEPDKPNPGAADCYVLIDGTDLPAVRALIETGSGQRRARWCRPAPTACSGTFRGRTCDLALRRPSHLQATAAVKISASRSAAMWMSATTGCSRPDVLFEVRRKVAPYFPGHARRSAHDP